MRKLFKTKQEPWRLALEGKICPFCQADYSYQFSKKYDFFNLFLRPIFPAFNICEKCVKEIYLVLFNENSTIEFIKSLQKNCKPNGLNVPDVKLTEPKKSKSKNHNKNLSLYKAGTGQICPYCRTTLENIKNKIKLYERSPEKFKKAVLPGLVICGECANVIYADLNKNEEMNEYVDKYYRIVSKGSLNNSVGVTKLMPTTTPTKLKAKLDEYIVDQEIAKTVISTEIYYHKKRNDNQHNPNEENTGTQIQKSNILIIGPTGCGKTLLAETLSKFVNEPFLIADANPITESGYVGADGEDIIRALIKKANSDLSLAKHGIVYIDEIDKIAKKSTGGGVNGDPGGKGAQQSLLKIIEGGEIFLPYSDKIARRAQGLSEDIEFDTTNVLFMCGGSFTGLDDIIRKRLGRASIGLTSKIESKNEQSYNEIMQYLIPEDLINFGLMPELLGRLPIVVVCNSLDEKALIKILSDPKDAIIKQFTKIFKNEGIDLKFSKNAIKAIAREAKKLNLGARSLRSIVEEIMQNPKHIIPDRRDIDECIIDCSVIEKKHKPKYIKKCK